uniref:Uncharacterized protein n=1 Tax=Arundo donax TaxID=35708 RepID=A0A0A8XWJ6_ARUDO
MILNTLHVAFMGFFCHYSFIIVIAENSYVQRKFLPNVRSLLCSMKPENCLILFTFVLCDVLICPKKAVILYLQICEMSPTLKYVFLLRTKVMIYSPLLRCK